MHGEDDVYKNCHSRLGPRCSAFTDKNLVNKIAHSSIILPDRLRDVPLKKSWIKQFVNLMKTPPSKNKFKTKLIYHSDLTKYSLVCFRSVLFTRNPFNKNRIMKEHLRNIHFLSLNGIEKQARPLYKSANPRLTGERCRLNVTLTNRRLPKSGRSKFIIPRYIPNIN